ncbi:urate hydroxylase PuuD, partial [Pseudomonas aeruginosa]
ATGGDAPAAPAATHASNAGTVSGADFDKVHHVIQERCTVCHSAKPTSQLFSTAPGGIMLDTPQQIQQLAPNIQAQALASQIMP